MDIQSLSTHPHADGKSGEVLSSAIIPVSSQQSSSAAFSVTTQVDGELF